ncbi:AfsR/SARP family transcriptional regulator [Actinomadura opuntiae]|uniref:AfsR/SARP family transcriptional regulator n=1 Tax=Actinomadura sp. OS1-43 TaxID=604315 RepID=UPI00255ABF43|nr:BTAD domain-containing putative transcriptional regulator [Actinomadura sp. OS1-43]MDL4817179.1 BTAD domain-containing putative transcriptional regulator [Actinomadura sp. OS1-43]
MISYRVLGSLEVARGDRILPIGSPRQRTVLACLLLRAGRPVPVERLVDLLWDEAPPDTARAATHVHVGRLRRTLGDAVRIETRPDGYVLDPPKEAVDLLMFDDLVAQAGALGDTEPDTALALLREAVGLWRGPILPDVPSATRHREEIAPLTERCVEAAVQCYDLEVALGNHRGAVSGLTALVAAHPLRERARAQLMLALYRSGRRAEALEVYRDTAVLLRRELGLDPGEELRELHAAVLADAVPAPSLLAASRVTPVAPRTQGGMAGADPWPAPTQLPYDVAAFTGRQEQLGRLRELIASRDGTAIVAVAGMAGVGKSALVVHLAHRLKQDFPDGQLFVNLRGFEEADPLQPCEVLQRFLRALGAPGEHIPTEADELAAAFRSRVAGKRLLIVLDNARSSEQVRPLLPGEPACLVLITSRRRLDGLVAREGARQLLLDAMPPGEGARLLERLVGREHTTADPRATRALVELCGGLPLVLRIAAARLQQHPGRPLGDLVEELSDEEQRLGALAVEGDDSAVRATLNLSYRPLPGRIARLLRLLSLHPGTDCTVAAAAAIAGTDPAETRTGLRRLTDAHLLQEICYGRYAMHDLVRLYARQLADTTDSTSERGAAIDRMIDYYLATADAASRPLEADTPPPPRRIRHPPAQRPHFSGYEGLTWLDAERANCRAVAELAFRLGRDERTWQLVDALWIHQLMRMHRQDWIELHTLGLAAARQLGDAGAEQRMLRRLARGHARCGRFDEATELGEKAIALARRLDAPRSQACAMINLAATYEEMGAEAAAIELYASAASLAHAHRLRAEEALARANTAGVLLKLERPKDAATVCERAIELFGDLPATHHRVTALIWAAEAHLQLGETGVALDRFRQALADGTRTGDREAEAEARYGLGKALLATAGSAQALPQLREARSIFAELAFPQARSVGDLIEQIEGASHEAPADGAR